MNHYLTMKKLPESERPYEKFMTMGASALSDADLLAIVLRTGSKNKSAVDLARELLASGRGNLLNLYDLSIAELQQYEGIGRVKAIQLKAIAELSQRISATANRRQISISDASTIADFYMERMRHYREEHLLCAYFDYKCHFLGDDEITVGSVCSSIVPPAEIFSRALKAGASRLILLHNHPSGDPSPSEEDLLVTGRLSKGALLVGLELMDHIIIGDRTYYSFLENHDLLESDRN